MNLDTLLEKINAIRIEKGDGFIRIKDLFEDMSDMDLRNIASNLKKTGFVDTQMSQVPKIKINAKGIEYLNGLKGC
jgi:hypothetical protein